MKKIYKYLIILTTFSIIIVSGYIFYTKNILESKETEYELIKFAEHGVSIDRNSTITEKDNTIFLANEVKDYLKIYNKKGENISPKEIDNINLTSIMKVEKNNEFLGYVVNVDNKGYYINEAGTIVLSVETKDINALEGYIDVSTDKLCYKSDYDVTSDEYCSKIYDLNGNLLIDGEANKYYRPQVIYNQNNDVLFLITKNEKWGIIDKNNNIIVDFEYSMIDYYEYKNIFIAKKGINLIDIYDITGKLLKNINLNDIEKNKDNSKYAITYAEQSFYLNDTIYLIDENYELKEYNNIYHINNGPMGMNEEYKGKYYITDDIYIKDTNGIYTIHNLKGEKIIDEEFKFVGPSNPTGHYSIGVPNEYFALCKNKERTECGAIDYKGNIILKFENEINNYQEDKDSGITVTFQGFKNNNQYFDIINGKITNKITCTNNQIKSNITNFTYNKNTVVVSDENVEFSKGGHKIMDYDCNDLSETKYHNIYETENFIVAENVDGITYDVYNINGKIINSKNIDKNKLTYFLGYNDKKLYFGNENNIYVLKESK